MSKTVLFETIRTEGALLPPDILARISARDLDGLTPPDYHLAPNESLNEATNRAWLRLRATWATFITAREKLAPGDPGTTITRERCLLPLFQELGFGRLVAAGAVEIGEKKYPVSHGWQHTPIHLVGCNVKLDKPTPGVTGAARSSPHSLVQELLNRKDEYLWGMVSNGLQIRLLRDNVSLTRNAYIEFDLEAMMSGEAYPDFVLLWLLCHQSRFEADRPSDCWLERWSEIAREQGIRFLEGLRDGVEAAIAALGQGFLAHKENGELRQKLRSGTLSKDDYYRQLLRMVYRLLFLFVAEDRELLLNPAAAKEARERYLKYYATRRLRRLALRRGSPRHHDLYAGLRVVMQKLGASGCPELALPALGSFLFSLAAVADIENCELANSHLLDAIHALTVTHDNGVRRTVDYRNLGSEELGSVYESLLELHPRVEPESATFTLAATAGSERKKTGTYYTPSSLIASLLDSALAPVLNEAAAEKDAEQAILRLKVVDPAAGSGHFLVAAAHRIAKRLAAVRTGDEEPSPEALHTALRDVIGHSIYGVDVNPMAVELCKVSLWMEAIEPGKPLSFLEHRIKLGNSLLGATPGLMRGGIPDDAFKPLEGDDPEAVKKWKRLNKSERTARAKKQTSFAFVDGPWHHLGDFRTGIGTLDNLPDDTIEGVQAKQKVYEEALASAGYLEGKFLADAWCAAFVYLKDSLTEYPITEDIYREIETNPLAVAHHRLRIAEEVQRLAADYRFFHWHLEFPDVFAPAQELDQAENPRAGWDGGFDVVLGNPPWERVKLQEREWFAPHRPDIANAPNAAARGRMIEALREENPALYAAFREALREADGESHLVRNSGRFPLCGRGDINTYAVFAETMRAVLGPKGRVGCIVPSGIATDDTTKFFFRDLMESQSLVSLYDFENAVGMFEGVGHGRFKFCLLTMTSAARAATAGAQFVFFAHYVDDVKEDHRRFTLSAEDLALLNPNTRTCPIFRSRRDAELCKSIYRHVPVLIREGPPEENLWGISFSRMFDMSNDSGLFRTCEQLEDGISYRPLYEAKMMHHYTHRYGDYAMRPEGSQDSELPRIPAEKLADPNYAVTPRYCLEKDRLYERLGTTVDGYEACWAAPWLLAFRDIARSTDERTALFAFLPLTAVGNNCPLIFTLDDSAIGLVANLSSFAFDWVARLKVAGTHLNFFIVKQFPVLSPQTLAGQQPFIWPRVLELVYTSWDMAGSPDTTATTARRSAGTKSGDS
jgi:hypothetical protein